MNIKQKGFTFTKVAGKLCSAVLLAGVMLTPAHAVIVAAGDGDTNILAGASLAEQTDLDAASTAQAGVDTTQDASIASNAAGITTNTASIASNAAGITTNAASIASNAAGISTNVASIASNALSIASNGTEIDLIKNDQTNGQVEVLTATIGAGGLTVEGSTALESGVTVTGGDSSFTSADGSTSLSITDAGVAAGVAGASTASGLTLDEASASLEVTNSLGNTHGLVVGTSSTTLSGGTTSSQINLNDNGAQFSSSDLNATFDMGDHRITGVADGINADDAINKGQLDRAVGGLQKQIDDNTSGIATVAAMANIPAPLPGDNYAIGMGFGSFQGEQALAIGASALVGERVNLKLSAGVSGSDVTVGAGVGMSWK